jgi:hypothetical protein
MKNLLVVILCVFCLSPFLSAQQYGRVVNGPDQIQYYDAKDSLIKLEYIDTNGKLKNTPLGYAVMKFKRDNHGNIIEQSYFDENGKPATDELGVSKWVMKYNVRNQKTYQAEYGTNGKILKSTGSVHHIIFEWFYDDNGKLLKTVTTEYYE